MPVILQDTAPATVGLSSRHLDRIADAMRREIETGNIPGAVVGIMREGKLAYLQAFGSRDPASKEPLKTDSIFSIASMTKAMTSAAIMMLHEEGRVLLGDPVGKYLPELADLKVAAALDQNEVKTRPAARQPTVQDLLRHTSGLTYRDRGTSTAHKMHPGGSITQMITTSKAETLTTLAKAPLLFDPGSNWEYGFSTDVLGFIVEAVSGQTLEAFLKARLWHPLGMADTAFDLPAAARGRYALALPTDPLTGARQSIHHAKEHTALWHSGGGGAVSTATDYLKFAEMIRCGGRLGRAELLGRKTVQLMTSDHLATDMGTRIADSMDPAAMGYGFGLGFAVRRQNGVSAMVGSAGDFYWSGVYGTYFWVDPVEKLTAVFMAAAPGMIRMRYRQMIRGLVYQAIA
jgi:CubicO group peptidase (beta-lactamase class C family)